MASLPNLWKFVEWLSELDIIDTLFKSEILLTIKGSALKPVSIELTKLFPYPKASLKLLKWALSPKTPK